MHRHLQDLASYLLLHLSDLLVGTELQDVLDGLVPLLILTQGYHLGDYLFDYGLHYTL